jgi:murein DD-endopeptidase MepM/ murein hydrolase activator NlpD
MPKKSTFEPILLNKKPPRARHWRWILAFFILGGIIGAFAVYRFFFGSTSSSNRWQKYFLWRNDPDTVSQYMIEAGTRCDEAPFAFPTTGVIFGLWDESYRPGHRHQGLDIFPGTEVGVTPVYAAYAGYLTRNADWKSSLIIRIPEDPLNPSRQIWIYYTHLADKKGNSLISDKFPPGTKEIFVETGTFLGHVGNYSGDPTNPTGIHLHFSIVKDNGQGMYRNELEIKNTYDPTPYFNLPVNHKQHPNDFPVCTGSVITEDWPIAASSE